MHELAALVPAASNAAHYAQIVREAAVFRDLIRVGNEIAAAGLAQTGEGREAVELAERAVFDLAQTHQRQAGFKVASEAVDRTFNRLRELAAAGKDIVGLPSGFQPLDRMTSGFHPGNLVLLAARPSIGKSALASAIIANTILRQDPPIPVPLFRWR